MAGKSNKRWATELAAHMQGQIRAHGEKALPTVDVAEVLKIKPQIVVRPIHDEVTYDEDDLLWAIDKRALVVGDIVLLSREPSDQPIVVASLDGNDPDPTLHPAGKRLKSQINEVASQSRFWKSPVDSLAELQDITTDADGTIRLLRGETSTLYRFVKSTKTWAAVSGSGGGGASAFDDLTDVSLTTPTANQLVRFDGTNWVNFTPGASSGLDADLLDGQHGSYYAAASSLTSYVQKAGDTMTGPLTFSAGSGARVQSYQPSAGGLLRNDLLEGDVNPSFQILGSGEMRWGAGGGTVVDVNLYRPGANVLQTDDFFRARRDSASWASFGAFVAGDSYERFVVAADGGLGWGSGSSARDTNLYRHTLSTLRSGVNSDDKSLANTMLRLGGNSSGAANATYAGTGEETTRHTLSFSSYRDVQTNTLGAKIVAVNKTAHVSPDWWRVQHTDLAFFTLSATPTAEDATTEKMRLTSVGQLQVLTSGSTGGLKIGGAHVYETGGAFVSAAEQRVLRASTSDFAIGVGVNGEALDRFKVIANGVMWWGDGTNTRDTNLYRSSANSLRTDDLFLAGAPGTGVAGIGSWPANSAFVMFADARLDQTVAGNYAVLANGNTYLNASTGNTLYLRNNNADVAIVTADGVQVAASKYLRVQQDPVGTNDVARKSWLDANLAGRKRLAATITVSGWYRIASNGTVADGGTTGSRAIAKFLVTDTASSQHSSTAFYASYHYGNNPTISLLNRSYYAGHGAIRKIRIVEGDVYEGAAVEVYIDIGPNTSVPTQVTMFENEQANGWTLEAFTAGSIPTGHAATQLDLDVLDGPHAPVMGLSANGVNNGWRVFGNGRHMFGTDVLLGSTASGVLDITSIGTVNQLDLDGKRAINFGDAWLRINEANAFSSGIYCGTSLLRTDGILQVGNGGAAGTGNGTMKVTEVPGATQYAAIYGNLVPGGANYSIALPTGSDNNTHINAPTGHSVIFRNEAVEQARVDASGILLASGKTVRQNAAPTVGDDLVNKTYADTKVSKAGDTMTGNLVVNKSSTWRTQQSDVGFHIYNNAKSFASLGIGSTGFSMGGGDALADWELTRTSADVATLGAGDKIRDTSDPVHADDLSRKSYVDTKVAKTGDTMSGVLWLEGNGIGVGIKDAGGTHTKAAFDGTSLQFGSGTADPDWYLRRTAVGEVTLDPGDVLKVDTRPAGTNDTTVATTAFVKQEIASGGGGDATSDFAFFMGLM